MSGTRPCRDVCGVYAVAPLHGYLKTRRGLHQKPFWSPKRAKDCTKNRFEAQNVPRIAPKTVLKPKTGQGLHQKPF
nr:MAG TPA: hypothetical protein [Caudoviricetes sp.]